MAGPAKTIRPFRGPGDVARMFQRLSRSASAWRDASPIEKASFLSVMQPAYAAYDFVAQIKTAHLTAGYFDVAFIHHGAGFNPEKTGAGTGPFIPGFWSSPVFAENRRTASVTNPTEQYMSGWYFLVKDISIEYFTSVWAAKAGQFHCIRAPVFDLGEDSMATPPNIPNRWGLVGNIVVENTVLRQIFSTRTGAGLLNINSSNLKSPPGWLRNFPLFTNSALYFQGIGGLSNNDRLRMTISGEWRFSPYYLESGEEPNQ